MLDKMYDKKIILDKQLPISLSRQLFEAISKEIRTGNMRSGEKLPSTRAFAKVLGTSRNTVTEAYEMLLAEGYILTEQGKVSRVAEGIDEPMQNLMRKKDVPHGEMKRYDVRFETGKPDIEHFDRKRWHKLIRQASGELEATDLEYQSARGYSPLCEEISKWLFRSRGMLISPSDIFITNGTTHSLNVLADMLVTSGDKVAIESPSHPAVKAIFKQRGASILQLDVDREGIETEPLTVEPLKSIGLKGLVTTPSHQFPLGGVLPIKRRLDLIRHACENQYYIIEDDYDSEFNYSGQPVSSLHSLAPETVIYLGSFSKTVFPSLRIGFAILPKALHEMWIYTRTYLDVHNSILEQKAMTLFIKEGYFERHILSAKRLYMEKREVLIQSLKAIFDDEIEIWGVKTGLHVVVQFKGIQFDEALMAKILSAGIYVKSVSEYADGLVSYEEMLILGYGHLTVEQIRLGLSRLNSILKERTDLAMNLKRGEE